jgi:hypothetical protein
VEEVALPAERPSFRSREIDEVKEPPGARTRRTSCNVFCLWSAPTWWNMKDENTRSKHASG